MSNPSETVKTKTGPQQRGLGLSLFLMALIILAGAYLRLVGMDWDENQHLHPDERFLTMVEAAIHLPGTPPEELGAPPSTANQRWREGYADILPDCEAWGGYFDTACSPLNPNNRGYDFYVYGTLPIFIVRYVAEELGKTGYGEVYLVGRALSALADLMVLLLVYAIGTRLYDRRVGVLAAAFSASSVLLIQQSHFFTVDTFTNLFIYLTVFLAVEVAVQGRGERLRRVQVLDLETDGEQTHPRQPGFWSHPLLPLSLLFGIALGMAVASKINAAPFALLLPAAALIYLFSLPPEERERQGPQVLLYLVMAGFVSLLSFRLFQPYAFQGPHFWDVGLNRAWLDDLKTLHAQTSGDVDFPPALQWARRPVWFSLQNMVLWGLGLPLGILAWAGFLWMGWRIARGEHRSHALLWGGTAAYFVWQSLQWNSTMRYQLPIYPSLAIMAAWFAIAGFDHWKGPLIGRVKPGVVRGFMKALGMVVLVLTGMWAYAFTRIYTRPHTRVEATRWLFQNMPGSVNLELQTEDGPYNQPLAYPQDSVITAETPLEVRFTARRSGVLTALVFPHIVDRRQGSDLSLRLAATTLSGADTLQTNVAVRLSTMQDQVGEDGRLSLAFLDPLTLTQGQVVQLLLEADPAAGEVEICGPLIVRLRTIESLREYPLYLDTCLTGQDMPYTLEFVSEADGILQSVDLAAAYHQPSPVDLSQTLEITLVEGANQEITRQTLIADFAPGDDPRGRAYQVPISKGVPVYEGQSYTLRFALLSGDGALKLSGSAPANESSWDDGLPLRMDGYDPYGGIYQGGLNFEMYWDDNSEKYQRFVNTLDQADYVLITSSRQWGSTTRLPERYPLTTEYYYRLLGCPPKRSIEWCYNVARPGMFQGDLGFELVKVFQSNPTFRGLEINDQFAEEAFTVYDHPKVFVFQKSEDYDPERVRRILGAVDLSKVVRITPKQADSHPGNLLLPPDRLEEQRQGGTWSHYFNPAALHNRFQLIGVLLWYLAVSLLGWIVYPIVRFALSGLDDRGYPLARIAGLLLVSVLVFLMGSARIPFERPTIWAALGAVTLLAGVLAYVQRDELRQEWRTRRRYFLQIEGLTLLFFIAGLLIRYGNPDLWHPWKGGEKPMDFSYFNAVLKSTSFPPYDPWFAGGYINYYYYGFLLVGVPVKLLGIVPSIAYNLILPTLLSMSAMGAFSLGWNLFVTASKGSHRSSVSPFIPALSAAFLMTVLGNLGIVQMFFQAFQKIVAPGGDIFAGGFLQRLLWTVQGFFKTLGGAPLPIRMDEWYWNPSRVIAYEHGSPITEFPYFTFLYADLHAHLIAQPVSLLVLAWAVSVVTGKFWLRKTGGRSAAQVLVGLLLGGVVIGALYPINLSDIYTYLPLGVVAAGYAGWRYLAVDMPGPGAHGPQASAFPRRLMLAGSAVVGTAFLSVLIYRPYWHWYGQGYSEVKLWWGTHTPSLQYLSHWGLLLFVLVSWMVYETIDWMAKTPVSALARLRPYKNWIWSGVALLALLIVALGYNRFPEGLPEGEFPLGLGVHIAWWVIPLIAWTGILLLRPGLQEPKRLALFFTATGLALTLMVEIVVVSGDIGRMNTVFKFYLQAWTLFAVSAGAALGWLLQSFRTWRPSLQSFWPVALGMLVFSAALYPLLGTAAKIQDRMEVTAPHTLDGMTYMRYATYHDEGVAMDLSQDYNAIRWLQDNVVGSPVIVEANSVEYRWGTRFTVYTGLPGVVGWNWHQRQQRTITPHDWVFERVDAVHQFYQTEDIQWAQDFLARYGVRYILFGQLEQAKYAGPGLEKFEAQDGVLWREVFRDRDTVVYEVLPPE